jgi:hypothetical protein
LLAVSAWEFEVEAMRYITVPDEHEVAIEHDSVPASTKKILPVE